MNRVLLTLVVVLSLIACDKALPSPASLVPLGGTNGGYQAICNLYGQSPQPIVCIDFPVNSATEQSSCSGQEVTDYAAEGVAMAEYVGINGGGVTTSCAGTNAGLTVLGSCTLSDRVIRYYDVPWTTTTAQADCSSQSGQWSQ